MRSKGKLAFFTIFLSASFLHADWIPEECLPTIETEAFASLNDSDFRGLKMRVSAALKGSWCTEEKMNLLMDLTYLTKPSVCVEIGAFTGSSVLPVAATLKRLKQGKIYAIDAWSNEEAIRNLAPNDPNTPWWSSVNMADVKIAYNHLVANWRLDSVCQTLHSSSENAASQIDAIDFLHLDGNFSEKGAFQDLRLYLPKVKSGGYVLLSNIFISLNGKQPKLKLFCELFDSCEMVCEIEKGNAALFRKL